MIRSLVLAILMLTSTYAYSGRCDYPSDIARDGSRCGDRAASVRPGGRNPDTDWIKWVLLGVVVFFIFTSSKKKNSSRNYNPPRRTERPANPPASPSQNSSPRSHSSTVQPEHPKIPKEAAGNITHGSVDNIEVRKILKDFYSLDVEAEFELPFFQVCLQAKELGGNNHDAAARYVLTQLGSLQEIPGDNITKFYDAQTKNLVKTKDLQSLGTPGYLQALNLMRAMRGLKDLEVS